MTRTRCRIAGLTLLLVALAGCRAAPPALPVGAVCALPSDRGIGGTGAAATAPQIADRGIGGTGSPTRAEPGATTGRTGVLGTITGFGSICVNGLEIRYAPGQTVRIDGTTAPMSALRLGQVVQVEAEGGGEVVTADEVEVAHEVIGPVERVDSDGTIHIVGQRVRLGSWATGLRPAALRPGEWVAVSGLRRGDGSIVATRVDGRQPRPDVYVAGPAELTAGNRFRIGGIEIAVGTGNMPEPGARVLVRGRLTGGVVQADEVQSLPLVPFAGRVGRLSIQAYVEPRDGSISLGSGGSLPLAPDLSGPVASGLGILSATVGPDEVPVVEAFHALRSTEPGDGQGGAIEGRHDGEADGGAGDSGESRGHGSDAGGNSGDSGGGGSSGDGGGGHSGD